MMILVDRLGFGLPCCPRRIFGARAPPGRETVMRNEALRSVWMVRDAVVVSIDQYRTLIPQPARRR